MDLIKFADFIKELRKEKNLTQEQLADELHVHRTTVVKWESGSSLPLNDTLVILSKYFNVSVDELLAGERITEETTIEDRNRVTLAILKDRRKSIRMAMHFAIISFILAVSFLVYYFVTTYNSIHVYTVAGIGENIKTQHSLLIVSNDKVYLRIGNFYNNDDEIVHIDNITLYIDDGYETKVLFSGDPNELIVEKRVNMEIFNIKKLQDSYDDMYLFVKYDDKEDRLKLTVVKDFENKSLFQLIFRNTTENYEDIDFDIKLSDKFKYDEETNTYKLKDDDVEIFCSEDVICKMIIQNDSKQVVYEYDKYTNTLYYHNVFNGKFSDDIMVDLNKKLNKENRKIYQEFKEKILDKYLK